MGVFVRPCVEEATNLEFEKAARIRDELKRLREMELDVLEGAQD